MLDEQMEPFFRDTRRFKRLNIDIPVTFRLETPFVNLHDREDIKGSIENISTGGALVITSIFIPKGAILSIKISIKHLIPELPELLQTKSKIINPQVKVVSLKVGEGGTFKMGVEFLGLKPKERQIINKFVKEQLKKT